MRCFDADEDQILDGLPLSGGKLIKTTDKYDGSEIELCDELAQRMSAEARSDTFSFSSPRILKGDIDNRSKLWLVPETQATANHALVRFAWRVYRECDSMGIQVAGEGSELLVERSSMSQLYSDLYALAQLAPGGALIATVTTWKLVRKRDFIIMRTTVRETRKEVVRLQLTKEGKLEQFRLTE